MDYPKADPRVGLHNGKFTDGSSDGTVKPSLDPASWANAVTDEILNVIVAGGLAPDELDHGQMAVAVANMIAEAIAGIDLPTNPDIPADIPFIAGYTGAGGGKDLAVQVYGSVKLARAITIQGEVGGLGLAGTGADVVVDIERNGVSVYTIKPKFAAGATALTAGVLDATKVACAAGDVLTFKVPQKGSTIAGQQLRFTLKAKVS